MTGNPCIASQFSKYCLRRTRMCNLKGYSLQPLQRTLPGRLFSAHNAFFTCPRYNFQSGIVTTLQDFSVAGDTCNVYWFFHLLVYVAKNNGFTCDYYKHRAPKFTGPTLLSVTSEMGIVCWF